MESITSIAAMQRWSEAARRRGERIGFVPTMGALHAGHLSLVGESRQRCTHTVVSIFVNPLQFGPHEDFERYPRDIERDSRLLGEAGADAVFLPAVAEMYPDGFQTAVEVAAVTRGLCGASRPAHFRGVTTVVAKLFHIVHPHVAVFGQKDFQQLVTIRRMVQDLAFGIEIVGAPIAREADGLAMSSRNAYLSPAERRAARCLSAALTAANATVGRGEADADRVVAAAGEVITREPLARLEYAALTDPDTLEEVATVRQPALLALAVHVGATRLIDNMILRPPSSVAEPLGAAAAGLSSECAG